MLRQIKKKINDMTLKYKKIIERILFFLVISFYVEHYIITGLHAFDQWQLDN